MTKEELIEKLEEQAELIEYLKGRHQFLVALEVAGVDNWSGYSYAFEVLGEFEDDQS